MMGNAIQYKPSQQPLGQILKQKFGNNQKKCP